MAGLRQPGADQLAQRRPAGHRAPAYHAGNGAKHRQPPNAVWPAAHQHTHPGHCHPPRFRVERLAACPLPEARQARRAGILGRTGRGQGNLATQIQHIARPGIRQHCSQRRPGEPQLLQANAGQPDNQHIAQAGSADMRQRPDKPRLRPHRRGQQVDRSWRNGTRQGKQHNGHQPGSGHHTPQCRKQAGSVGGGASGCIE